MEKEIGSVEDTYTVKDEYNSITSKLPLLDDGELRASLFREGGKRYDYFKEIIAGMSDEISRYEAGSGRGKETGPGTGCKRCRKQAGPGRKECKEADLHDRP